MSCRERSDNFSLWYRFRAIAVFNLLQVVGPARLGEQEDPRLQIEHDYLRRKALHRPRQGKPPLAPKPVKADSKVDFAAGVGVVGVLAILGLIAWAVASA